MWQDYAKEIGVSVTNLTQQQKIQAEVNGILEETRFQTGDAAKVANTFSGVTAALSYAFANLKRAFGDFIKPILQSLIPAITTAINWLTKLFDVLAKITALLFGKKISSSTSAAAKNAQATQEATAGTLDNTNDLANATKKANKQADKQLAAFDEIEKISENIAENAGASSAGGATGSDSNSDISFSDMDIESVGVLENSLSRIAALMQHINELFMQGFAKGFGDIDTNQIESSLARIKTLLKNIFTDVDVTSAAKKAVDSFIVAFGAMVGAVSSIGVSIATGIVGGIEKFLEANQNIIKADLIQMFDIISEINGIVADWWAAISNIFSVFAGENAQNMIATVLEIFYTLTSNITTLCLKIGRDILELVTKPITQNQEAIKQLLNDGLGFLNNWWLTISTLITGFMQTLQTYYDMFIKPIFDRITQLLTIVAAKVIDVWTKNILPTLNNLSNKFREVIENQIMPAWGTMLEAMKPVFDFLFWAWDNLLKPLLLWLVDNFLMQVSNVVKTITDIIQTFSVFFGDIISGQSKILKGLVEFLEGVFTLSWSKVWNGIKNIVVGVSNIITNTVKGFLTLVVDAVNFVIRCINTVTAAASKVPGFGWMNFTIPEIQVPKLAQGAVIPPNKEFLAILGDQKQGTNIETPLQTMIDAFNAALEQNSNTNNANITVVLELDKREFAKAVYKANNQETQRVGIRLGGAY